MKKRIQLPVILIAFPGMLAAQGGSLDPYFANAGVLRGTFGNALTWFSDIVLTPDDNILAAGATGVYGSREMLVCRFLHDGTPDPAFGTAGVVHVGLGGDAWARGILYTSEGILLTGFWNNEFVLARLTHQGQLDPLFGNGGVATFETDAPWSSGYSICLSGEGILVLGSVTEMFSVWRYRHDGSIDEAYGEGGCRTIWDNEFYSPGGIAALADGSCISAGSRFMDGQASAVLIKLDAGGDPDPGFGGTGVVGVDPGPFDDAFNGMHLLPDGNIVVAGYSQTSEGQGQGMVARFTSEGSLDTDFGTDGITFISNQGVPVKTLHDMACMADGTIVAAGLIIYSTAPAHQDLLVVQLTEEGALDACFGEGGEVITHLDSNAVCTTMTVQPDRKVLIGGWVRNPGIEVLEGFILRYLDCPVHVAGISSSAAGLSIAPVPVSTLARIRIPAPARVPPILNVYDAMGRLALRRILSHSFSAGDWSEDIDFTFLAPGLYTAELHVEERIFRKAFIKD